MSPRILFVVNVEWYFWSHRRSLARAVRDSGCSVTVAAGVERNYRRAIESDGFRFIPLSLQRHSIEPISQLAYIWEVAHLYRKENPDLVHHITIKPVLYGSLAAKFTRIPAVINTIPGLGFMFLGTGPSGRIRRQVATIGYRIALSGERTRVIFQNPDDRELFVNQRIVPAEKTFVIRGSGVDPRCFVPGAEPNGTPIVLLASRLLYDKGVGELVEAAQVLRRQGTACRFVLVGAPDPGNPNSVSQNELEKWQSAGIIEWWGLRDDMPSVVQQSSIVALPSYREGVPRILIEAAASGRPIIATDVPGCREIVKHGENGLLVPLRDAQAIADAITLLLKDPQLRARMGARGREIALAGFTEEHVIRQTLAVYHDLLGAAWPIRQ